MIASDIASLRASSSVFLKHDFYYVKWAGVFGSFARETQTESSDVDVVVIQEPRYRNGPVPPDTLHLEDALSEVWGRKVDVIYIDQGEELRGYITIEALLCSRTLFGSDQDDEVVYLRQIARDVLGSGFTIFSGIISMIRKTQSMVSKVQFKVNSRTETKVDYSLSIILINYARLGISAITAASERGSGECVVYSE